MTDSLPNPGLSGKVLADHLAELLVTRNIRNVVLSPGSRNAPLVMAFNRHPDLTCHVVVDERSAAFFALGMAQQTRQPVVLACTSGTAGLNYAPALAEAYYQKLPLVAVTADRPPEWIDQGDGQTIRQSGQFDNFILKSIHLPAEPYAGSTIRMADRQMNEVLDRCTWPVAGPVHINMPFSEPLYKPDPDQTGPPCVIRTMSFPTLPGKKQVQALAETWNQSPSKLVIVGLHPPDPRLSSLIHRLAELPDVAVLAETTSNLQSDRVLACIDRMIDGLGLEEGEALRPRILITFGGPIISRKIKGFLQRITPASHWHVSEADPCMDTFRSLSQTIVSSPGDFLEAILPHLAPSGVDYRSRWEARDRFTAERHLEFLKTAAFSDLRVFEILSKSLQPEWSLQWGNSSPVRYAQLFTYPTGIRHFGNRGTSGIDGCLSTAVGAAHASQNPTLLVVGDLSFFYDSNGLWNRYLGGNLRILVVNNGGGNIFRIIDGPGGIPELEEFFETPGHPAIRDVAALFGLSFYQASDEQSFREVLPAFLDFSMPQCAIMEVLTSNKINAAVLKSYFNHLRS